MPECIPDYYLEEEWEAEEKEKAKTLSRNEMKERVEFMKKCYIKGFSVKLQEILAYLTPYKDIEKSRESAENLLDLYENTLREAYSENFESELEKRDYMKEVIEIYHSLSDLIELYSEDYSLEDLTKEALRIIVNDIGEKSRRWVYRLNLYKDEIGEDSINFEVMDMKDSTRDYSEVRQR